MRLATEIDRGGKILKIAEVNQWLCPQKKKLAEELMRCCCGILWGIMWSRKPKPKWVSGTGENVLRKSNFGKKRGGRKIRNVFEEKKRRRESVKLRSVLFCFDLFCLAGSNIGRLLFWLAKIPAADFGSGDNLDDGPDFCNWNRPAMDGYCFVIQQ